MRYRSALLLASFFGLAAAQPSPDQSNLNGPLAVFLGTDHPTSPRVLDAMKHEVEAAVALSGIRVKWMFLGENTGVYSRIALLNLRGECNPDALTPASIPAPKGDTEPLGQTQVVDGQVLPFADIRCDSVRRLIGRDLRSFPAEDHAELLGRALGRVMAHELYHVLLRTTNHGRDGLARPVQSSADLLAPRDDFAQSDQRKLTESGDSDTSGFEPAAGR